jgi:hypothetical protein
MQRNTSRLPLDYDLTRWYINARRVVELVGLSSITPELRSIAALSQIDDNLSKIAQLAALKAEDISTLLPSLKRYEQDAGIANQQLRERLKQIVVESHRGDNRSLLGVWSLLE